MLARDQADTLFVGGHVWTASAPRGPLDGVAVAGGRIVAVGRADDLRLLRDRRTRVIPLAGRLLLPAFQDAHVHPVLGGLASMGLDLSELPDPDAWSRAVGEHAASHPEAAWIVGQGWTQDAFEGGIARRDALDAVSPERPALLLSRDRHAAWVNGAALRAAGISGATPDPPRGRIPRDEHGDPLGTLQEAAVDLVARCAPSPGADALEEGLRRGQAHLAGLGISAWHDAHVSSAQEAAYLALAGRGELTGRASLALRWDDERGPEQLADLVARRARIETAGDGRVRAVSVKVFQDGVIENRTAALVEPYLVEGRAGQQDAGESLHPPAQLREMCRAIDGEGFAVHAHAIGDRAVREVLDALTAARRDNGPRDARHAIAHVELVHPSDLPRFAAVGVIADCQPLWACREGPLDRLIRPVLGNARWLRRYPFGSLARLGVTLAMGSDWNVSTADPLRILEVAVTRTSPEERGGRPLGPVAERLTPEAALRAYTRGSALANHLEAITGTIEEGKAADLVLLDRDPLVEGSPFGEARVLLTMIAGRPVFEDPALGA